MRASEENNVVSEPAEDLVTVQRQRQSLFWDSWDRVHLGVYECVEQCERPHRIQLQEVG